VKLPLHFAARPAIFVDHQGSLMLGVPERVIADLPVTCRAGRFARAEA